MLIAGFLGVFGWQGSLSVQAKAMNGTEQNRVFLTAVAAAEDGTCPLRTHLAAVCLLLLVWKVPANKPSA